jgi:hypothetical protein
MGNEEFVSVFVSNEQIIGLVQELKFLDNSIHPLKALMHGGNLYPPCCKRTWCQASNLPGVGEAGLQGTHKLPRRPKSRLPSFESLV